MNQITARRMANAIRILALDAIAKAGEGHPGAPLGCAEIATALYTRHLRHDPADPLWPDRDRFVMSNGHGSMLVYALLHLTGYAAFGMDEIATFRRLGSICAGHPEREPHGGIEVTTGLLGQGIANAVGMAVAEAALSARFGADLVNHYTYALVGDGCLQEGIAHEVISLAGHLRLGKLVFLFDDNCMTDDGATELSISEDVPARFAVAGWHTQAVDGHDIDAVDAAITRAKADPRPSLIACRTVIGRGLRRLEGKRGAHGGRVFPEDAEQARMDLDWHEPPFVMPDDVLAAWRESNDRHGAERAAWQARLDRAPEAAEFRRMVVQARLPDGWERTVLDFKRDWADAALSIATSSEIVKLLGVALPELFSGAPDLEGPTGHKGPLGAFTATNRTGRYVHYGVREHAMGSMMNGIAAHGGLLPVGATYLVFSDYERPALRMAALMKLQAIHVFSHDSIGVGTNGATHQPVEYLASLRAMPNMWVLRPADTAEAAECWQMAVERRDGPCALMFPRQGVARVRPLHTAENLSRRGGYILLPPEGGRRRATVFATGSEVGLAVAARRMLQAQGVPTAVVSMPCWEAFEEQDAEYRAEIIGRGTARVAVEAAVRQGWDRYIGEDGGFVGMSGFGLSAPAEDLYRHFGITVEAIVASVLERL
jgi:transketolase